MVLRNESGESSDFCDLELAGVEPLTLEDITFQDSYVNNHNNRFMVHSCLHGYKLNSNSCCIQ